MARGDSDGDSAYVSKSAVRLLRSIMAIEKSMDEYSLEGICVRELRIRGPESTGATYQIIVKVVDEARDSFVGFSGADSLIDALNLLADRMGSTGLKLQPDIPYDERMKKAKKSKSE